MMPIMPMRSLAFVLCLLFTPLSVLAQDTPTEKEAAREVLKKDPASWTAADKDAWNKAKADLETTCAR